MSFLFSVDAFFKVLSRGVSSGLWVEPQLIFATIRAMNLVSFSPRCLKPSLAGQWVALTKVTPNSQDSQQGSHAD
jgi:hypothetical protein